VQNQIKDLKAFPEVRLSKEEIRGKNHLHMPAENDGPRRSNTAQRKKKMLAIMQYEIN